MHEEEATKFEKHELFKVILKLREWDELAKDTELNLSSNATQILNRYKEIVSSLCIV
jgi:hypothetical protein